MMMTHRSLTLAATTALALLGWSSAVTTARPQGQAPIGRSVEYVNGLETVGGEVLVRVRAGTTAAGLAALERAADALQSQALGTNRWRVLKRDALEPGAAVDAGRA